MTPAPTRPDRPMDGLTRRTLLRASGVVGATALLAGAARVGWEDVMQRAASTPLTPGTPILVLVTMYGGNDGLNTVVPYADPAYHDARPGLAYPPEKVLHLDAELGLNPGLTGLAQLWQDRRLAVIRGVGYPRPDHSHFRSMDIWQTASPQTPVPSGWIGRWLDVAGGDPLLALNIGDVLPPLAVGNTSTAAALSTGPARRRAPSGDAVIGLLARPDPADTQAAAQVAASYAAVQRVEATFAPALGGGTSTGPGDRSSLATQLDLVARCIQAGAPTRVYAVSVSGFDTHADELVAQQAQLTSVDRALTGFGTALAGHARAADVVVMAYSEFGRRVKANASEGTDHGTAGPVFVMGDRVRGGFHGDQPSLTDLDDGDLRTTTDFRAVYGELLATVLGTDPARVLDTHPAPLGFLAT